MARRGSVNLWIASALAFSIYLGFSLILPLFPFYVVRLGGGGFEIGLLFAAFMFTRALLARPFGKLSDRIGRKKVIVTGMFLYAFLAFLFTLPDDWWGLIFVRLLQGTASAMVWPVGEALVVDSVPAMERSKAISKYILLTNLGAVVGPFAGGGLLYLSQEVWGWDTLASYRLPFYFTSVIALAGAVFGLFLLKDMIKPKGSMREQASAERLVMDSIPARVRRSLTILYVNYFFEGIVMAMGAVVMVLFMEENFGVKDMGLYVANPATRALQADLAPVKVRGRLLGTIQSYMNYGGFVGPLVGGLMWDLFHTRVYDLPGIPLHGDSLPLILASVLGLVPAYLILRYVWEPKRTGKGIRIPWTPNSKNRMERGETPLS